MLEYLYRSKDTIMNLREEIDKDKKEESKLELSNVMLKFLNKEEISKDNYNKIIDELQRCIDEKIDISQTTIYNEEVNKIIFSNNILPVEVELFKKEYINYLNFVEFNNVLKKYKYNNIKDKYNNEEIEDIIWFLYQANYVESKKFIEFVDWFSCENNSYISIDKKNYHYWYYITIIKKILENKEYIYLNDLYFYDFWSGLDKGKKILEELNKAGIYLFDVRGNSISLHKLGYLNNEDFIVLVKDNPDEYNELNPSNPEDKEKINNSIINKINTYIYSNKNLSIVYFRYIVKKIYSDLSNKYLDDEITDGINRAMYQHAYYARMCEFRKIIKNRVETIFENLKGTVPFSYYKDVKVFVPSYWAIVFLNKRYIAIMRTKETVSGKRHTINGFDVTTGFLGENDYYIFKERDDSYETDLGGLLSSGSNKSPVSVTNRVIVGGILGGSTGAMLGAISAQERNSAIERNKNTHYELKHKIKNEEICFTLYHSNRTVKEFITFEELIVGKKYAQEFKNALDYSFSLPYEFDDDKVKFIEEFKAKRRTIKLKINKLNEELEEVNTIIENDNSLFPFGKKVKKFKEAVDRKEVLEKELSHFQEICDEICGILDIYK